MKVTMLGGERIDDAEVSQVLQDVTDLAMECRMALADGDADELTFKLEGIAGCARALLTTVDEARGEADEARRRREARSDSGVW
jgi:hypothetical protein